MMEKAISGTYFIKMRLPDPKLVHGPDFQAGPPAGGPPPEGGPGRDACRGTASCTPRARGPERLRRAWVGILRGRDDLSFHP